MALSQLRWHVVYDKVQPTKILATVGVSNETIQCIAYHYGFKDQNLDSRTSLDEHLWFSQKPAWDLHIAYSLALQEAAYDVDLIQSSIREILRTGAQAAVSSAQYAYFQVLVGIPVSQALTAAGITGIKKMIYGASIKAALKGVVM